MQADHDSSRRLPTTRADVLRAWFDVTADAMLAVDAAGVIDAANAHAEAMFGYPAGSLVGQPIEVLVPGHLRAVHRAHREAYMAHPRALMMATAHELLGLRHDGHAFPVGISLTPVETEKGVRVIASIRDISDTWRARQVLERARRDTFVMQIGRLAVESRDYELAIQQTPEMVATALGVPTVVLFSTDWNHDDPYIRAAFGLTDSGSGALTSTFGKTRFIRSTFGEGGPLAVTTATLHEERFASTRADLAAAGFAGVAMVPLFGRDEPLGAIAALTPTPVGFGHDEVAFLQSVANLLAAAVQRSRSEAQLAHAHRLDAIGQLTGGIAHDFNNLLTVVSGNLQLLEAELAGQPDAHQTIESALRAVDRGSGLTRKLLAFARRQPLRPRAVVPQPLMDELGHMLRRTLGETVAVEIECAADVPDVYADPNELDTALVNLALNARDAMPRGGRLRLVAQTLALADADNEWGLPAGRYVAFAVEDTGTGMTPDVRKRALEPFFTTKEAGKGSGLGLSMVYGFVTQSGGALTIDSRLGAGTRVAFALPVMAADARGRPRPGAATYGTANPHATILVVEDEPDVRSIAVRFLRANGYDVLDAATAAAALEILRVRPDVDLLFSDVVLGDGANGVELAREAQALRPALAVLLTSGYEGHPAGSDDAGTGAACDLLHKPYRREQLMHAVERALQRD